MRAGDIVKFTGHGYRRAKEYRYSELFGDREYRVEEVRKSCCNTFLILKGVEGMYSEVFFSKTGTPGPPIPHSTGGNEQRERGQTQLGWLAHDKK